MRKYPPIEDRFWASVNKTDGCWLWTAGTDSSGYGMLHPSGSRKSVKAHRLSYEIHKGPIPSGLLIRHTCDTPRCVNPSHLLTGTRQDNMDDAMERGRFKNRVRGERMYNSVLTEEIVRRGRQMKADGISVMAISRELGVTYGSIWNAINKGWAWL